MHSCCSPSHLFVVTMDEWCYRFSDCASCTANTKGCQWCDDKKCISAFSNCTSVSVPTGGSSALLILCSAPWSCQTCTQGHMRFLIQVLWVEDIVMIILCYSGLHGNITSLLKAEKAFAHGLYIKDGHGHHDVTRWSLKSAFLRIH